MNKNRNLNLDFIKVIAMIIIITIHVLQRTVYKFTDNWSSVFLLLLSVPILFFISGISYSKKQYLTLKGFFYDILKRGFYYMIPFIWFIFWRVVLFNQWVDFAAGFSELMEYPVSGLWFLWILLWISIVIDLGLLISYLFKKYKKLVVIIILAIAYSILIILRNNNVIPNDHFIGYDYFVIYIPVFLLGYLLSEKVFELKNKIISILLTIFGFIGVILVAIFNQNIIKSTFLSSQWMFYVGIISSLVFYFGFISLIGNLKFSKKIAFFGRFTLEAYMLHLILLKAWSFIDLNNNVALIVLTSIGLVLLCIVNIILVVTITYHIPFLHFVLFGRHYSKYKFENDLFKNIENRAYKLKN